MPQRRFLTERISAKLVRMDDVTKAMNHFSTLMEDQNAKLDAVLEAVGDMQKQVALIPPMRTDITELKQDMKVVKAAVTDLSNQVHDHERRITRLEAA